MQYNIFDTLGLLGSFLIAYFYFYSQYKYTFLNSMKFFIGNILGSGLIIMSLVFSSFNLASFFIETLWIAVSFYGMYTYHYTRKNPLVDLTIRQDELSIDGFSTKTRIRKFTKDDIGLDIMFNNPITGQTLPEKSMDMTTFLFNGTTMLTPNAITDSALNINDIENQWRMNKNCHMITLGEDIDYDKEQIEAIFRERKILELSKEEEYTNKPYLIIKTGFMEKISDLVKEDGNVDPAIFSLPKPGLTIEAAKFISELDLFGAILIDSISFESKESREKNFHTTHYLMNINEEEGTFTPLVYHIKTPPNKISDCSIRIGNIPSGTIPGYPVSVKVK